MREGGGEALRSDGPVVSDAEVRRLEERVRELKRQLGRRTLEVEILKEALARARSKKPGLLMRSSPMGGSR